MSDTEILTSRKLKRPSMYAVVFLNDDYTPMEFVVGVLIAVFNMDQATATQTMLQVHQRGRANVGPYTYEVAEHKRAVTMDLARQQEHPLQLLLEKV